jgi:hypothetical protein
MPVATPLLRRPWLKLACALVSAAVALTAVPAAYAQPAPVQRLGIFTLLGNSVRVVAKDLQEVMFKDVGMDDIALEQAEAAARALLPQAQLSRYRAPEQTSVEEQINIGTAAGRRGELPEWVLKAARADGLSHVLLITSSVGAMEFRTARSEVVGNNRVSGIGFFVSADGRTTNLNTGAVSSGYLAPFVQLRLSLIEVATQTVVQSSSLSDGFIVGPPTTEAPDPWRYLDRPGKARALKQLLTKNIARGANDVLQPK